MPNFLSAFAMGAGLLLVYGVVGLPVARSLALARIPPLALAPAFGWAMLSAIALPVFSVIGFGTAQVTVLTGAAVLAGLLALRLCQPPAQRVRPWEIALALPPALLPLAAILPKHVPTGIRLAPPIFDHVKIAVVGAILRDGLPVPNPFAGPPGPGRLVYYYLWHVSAAQNALLFHAGAWQAEAALTFFTACASMLLMIGISRGLGGTGVATLLTALLSLIGSLRPLLVDVLGPALAPALLPYNSDIGNWLNQAAWVPQHMQAACCGILSCLLIWRLGQGGVLAPLALILTAAAGFESSAWVGGVGFLAAGAAVALATLARLSWPARRRFLYAIAVSGGATLLLVLPLAMAELAANQARHMRAIAFGPYPVFGSLVPGWARPAADLLGFFPFLLFLFPAIVPGAVAFAVRPCRDAMARIPLGFAALASLAVAWLCRSTLDNNDLGWRVVLPALLVATPMAAQWLARAPLARCAAAALLASGGLIQTGVFAADYTLGQRPGDPPGFVRAAAMWRQVEAVTGPGERIANNPHALEQVTPWPVNIGWALLSDRPSCYAGWETVLAYAPMPRAALLAMNGRSRRLFAGVPAGTDLLDLHRIDHCDLALVTKDDAAWGRSFWQDKTLFRLRAGAGDWALYEWLPADRARTQPGAS